MIGTISPRRLALAATAAAALAAGAAQAQTPSGLTGIWLLDQRTYDGQEGFRPPLRTEAAARAEAQRQATENGGDVLSDNGKKCLPIGMPGLVTNEFALQFLETPGLVTVVSENSSLTRAIFLDGRAHPADQDPTWNGHSTGKWENGALVVDTVNLNDRTSHIPGARGVTSLTTKLTERYRLIDGGKTLVNELTVEDPSVLTRPWKITYRYHRAEPDAELWEYVCEVDAAGWSERFAGDPAYKPASASQ